METARPSGPGAGITLAVAIGLAVWGALLILAPWIALQLVGCVLLALAVWALAAFVTAPWRSRRRLARDVVRAAEAELRDVDTP